MTTGLYWTLICRRGTGDLGWIIVTDRIRDPWPQEPSFQRSSEARPGERAAALIQLKKWEKNAVDSAEKNFTVILIIYPLLFL